MKHRLFTVAAACLLLVSVSACGEPEVIEMPAPQEPTSAAIGYYCSMTVINHPGPKGQIHLIGKKQPLWFSSVRDTIAFTMLPEESKDIAGMYVNDMGRAKNWDNPDPGAWIEAKAAVYVIGSSHVGGMGAPEAVPFGDMEMAQAFAGKHGGRVVAFKDIPRDAILGNANKGGAEHQMHSDDSKMKDGEHKH
jgi:copper chaperone NosL